jgi:hypothetical protein
VSVRTRVRDDKHLTWRKLKAKPLRHHRHPILNESELWLLNVRVRCEKLAREHHHNEEYIKRAFSEIAVISQMTFVPKKNEKGQTYNGVVLLIREWINKTNGMLDTLNEGKEYRHNHCAKYHWLMTRHQIDWVPPAEEAIAGKTETTDV